jgi:Mor family transcriptional regulator
VKGWTVLASELLPPRLQKMVSLIGLPATMLLVEHFGGLRIYMPATPTPEHPFAELIGFDNLVRLCQEIAIDGVGDRFLLPRAQRALIAVRNAKICAEYRDGKSARMLAADHRMTERHVERIVSGVQSDDPRQASLAW